MILHFLNARLIDPEAQTDAPGSLTVTDGAIAAIGTDPPEGAALIDAGGACLAPGIVDWGVKIGEPGERHRESMRTAALAAAAGGVTTIVARPDTLPPIDTPEGLEFVTRRAAEQSVRIRHQAALTRAREGREMVEMGFLRDAGALAFTDGVRVVADSKILSRAMTYARGLGALIVGHPQDAGLSRGAAASAGKFASLYGIPAVSPLAERMGLERDLSLVEMTGAKYHADQITTAAALPLLERARGAGLDVTAGISIHHLTLNEYDVGDYRTFFRLTPPLRSEDDRMAMVQAVADGRRDRQLSHPPGRGSQASAVRDRGPRRGRAGNAAAGGDAAVSPGRAEPAAALARAVAEPGAAAGPAGRAAGQGGAGRSGAVRPGRAFCAGPLRAPLEIAQHAL